MSLKVVLIPQTHINVAISSLSWCENYAQTQQWLEGLGEKESLMCSMDKFDSPPEYFPVAQVSNPLPGLTPVESEELRVPAHREGIFSFIVSTRKER